MNGQLSVRQMTMIIRSVPGAYGRTLFTVQLVEPIERTANRIGADLALHYVRWRVTNAIRGTPLGTTL